MEVRDTTIPFANQGLVVITGENGVGKSSLFTEGPYYGLFGHSFRYGDRPAKQVVRNGSKYFAVIHEVDIAGEIYTIGRCAKLKENAPNGKPWPDGLSVWHNGVDEAQGHTADTQEWLNHLLGMSPMTYRTVGVFTGDTMKFPLLPDSKKKEILDELLQISALDGAQEACRKALSGLEGDAVKRRTRRDLLVQQMPQHEAAVERLVAQDATWAQDRDTRLGAARTTVENAETAAEALKADVGTIRDALQAAQTEYGAKQKKIEAGREKIRVVREDFIRRQTKADSAKTTQEQHLRGIRAALKSKVDLMGTACPKCGQAVTKNEEWVLEQQQHIEAEDQKLAALVAAVAEFREEEAQITEASRTLTEAAEKQTKRQKNINKASQMLETAQDRAASASNEAARAKARMQAIENETNPFTAQIEDARKRVILAQEELAGSGGEITGLEAQIEDEKLLMRCFSNKGARCLLLERAVPSLNLTASTVRAILETSMVVSFQVNGDDQAYAGSFNVVVDNPGKAVSYAGDSSGERRRIDMILLFSLLKMASQRGAKAFNQSTFDEPFENIDERGQQGILRLLQHEAKSRSSLFVITHAGYEIQGSVAKVWRVMPGGQVNFGV